LLEKAPFFALSAASAVLIIWAQSISIASMEKVPFLERVFTAAHAVLFYSYKMVVPLKLGPFYPHTVMESFQ